MERFHGGTRANGFSDESVQAPRDVMLPFSGNAFDKPHTAGHAPVPSWTASLTAHYPAERAGHAVSPSQQWPRRQPPATEREMPGRCLSALALNGSTVWRGGRPLVRLAVRDGRRTTARGPAARMNVVAGDVAGAADGEGACGVEVREGSA
ncbi:hypothetical protein RM844_19670 [Streptomyces sp. DSM 44915]|uniref:Uncharacterized protein n=1 Tax=Streptomyces chisholmiae TaxID=3075540 RepID=A0ABU2JWA6_9ACTN|nr:hypothetical protein [Streptomyces sp. DSM 44915]MDT0268508.1 hypothetical protein [Streptomyces sp. DSM 44915]